MSARDDIARGMDPLDAASPLARFRDDPEFVDGVTDGLMLGATARRLMREMVAMMTNPKGESDDE